MEQNYSNLLVNPVDVTRCVGLAYVVDVLPPTPTPSTQPPRIHVVTDPIDRDSTFTWGPHYQSAAFGPSWHVELDWCHRHLTRIRHAVGEPIAIAARGDSGAALAFPLGALYGWPILRVRRDVDEGHHRGLVLTGLGAGPEACERYVIVDDFVAKGCTIARIVRALEGVRCCGVVLPGGSDYKTRIIRDVVADRPYRFARDVHVAYGAQL